MGLGSRVPRSGAKAGGPRDWRQGPGQFRGLESSVLP